MKNTFAGLIHPIVSWLGLPAVVLAVGLAGCQKKTPPGTPAAPSTAAPAPAPAAAEPQVDKVLAIVNGTKVMESQVQQRIDVRYKAVLAKLAQQSPQMAAQQEHMLRQRIPNDLIIEVLLNEQARQAGIEVTPEQFQAEMVKQLAAQNPPLTVEQWQKSLEEQGMDFQAWKEYNLRGMKYEKLIEAKLGAAPAVTDADAQKYYDENLQQFQTPEQMRASHILISTTPTDPSADPNQVKAQAKQKAEEVLKKVKDGGDFAALAKENSSCPSSAQGGDLGLFPRGQMVKPFEDAAFAMKVGEVSDLVETEFGYHIIKVTEHHDPNQVSFEQAKPQIVEQLSQQKRAEAIRAYLESLRQSAKIVFPPGSSAAPEPSPMPMPIPAPADANAKQ